MIFRYNYSDDKLQHYDKINRCTINDSCVLFMDDKGIYKIGFHKLVRYIVDYYENCSIGNADGLCDYIGLLADSYDLTAIVRLVDGLDTDNEYYLVDYYDNIIPFNNMNELSEIYDIAEIINDMAKNDEIENYCEQLDSF